ncbi:hypothetical protein GCM10020258_58340 [Sphingomonas yabuuchiae]
MARAMKPAGDDRREEDAEKDNEGFAQPLSIAILLAETYRPGRGFIIELQYRFDDPRAFSINVDEPAGFICNRFGSRTAGECGGRCCLLPTFAVFGDGSGAGVKATSGAGGREGPDNSRAKRSHSATPMVPMGAPSTNAFVAA